MFTTPGQIGQLAREHHRQLLAEASQRQLRHQHYHPAAAENPDICSFPVSRLWRVMRILLDCTFHSY